MARPHLLLRPYQPDSTDPFDRIKAAHLLGDGADGGGDGHGGDDGADVGLEDVGAHAGDVTHVVAHVVGDDAGVAGVVLGDAGLDLAHQVGADVGGLGVDAAAHAREQRDGAGAHGEAVDVHGGVRAAAEPPEPEAHAQQAQAGHGQTHDRTGEVGDVQGLGLAELVGGLGGAAVALGGRAHARETGGHGAEGAGDEGDGGPGGGFGQLAVHHQPQQDEDGRDEVVIGSAVIDDTGKPLWNTRKGHPDACYVADVDPSRPGLEIFYGIETGRQSNTVCLVEAKTGRMIWGNPEITVHVHSQGMVGDIIPEHPGMECYAGEAKGGTNYWLYTARGERLSNQSLGELAPKAVFWLDGPTKVFVVGNTIYRWPREKIGQVEGRIVAIADCLGDWREEIITALDGEIRVYSTTVPATSRRVCLMQDRLYRTDVAMQTMGYFYPPQLGGTPLPEAKQ